MFDPFATDPNPYGHVDFGASTAGSSMSQPADDFSSYRRSLDELYGEGPALKQYQDYLTKAPVREQYQPSKLRRIGAAIAGGLTGLSDPRAGIAVARQTVDAPYRDAVEDWQMKGAGLRAAADIEAQRDAKRQGYFKAIMDWNEKTAENVRKNREVDIKAFDADTARNRSNWEFQIQNAKNQNEVDRLTAEKNKWEEDRKLQREGIQAGITRANIGAAATTGAARIAGASRERAAQITADGRTGSSNRAVRIPVEEAGKAEDDAMRSILNEASNPNSKWAKFAPHIKVKTKEEGGGIEFNPTDTEWFGSNQLTPEEIRQFQAEVEKRKNNLMNNWSFSGTGVDFNFDR